MFSRFILSVMVPPFHFCLFNSCEEGQPLKISKCSNDKCNSGQEGRGDWFKGRLGNHTETSLSKNLEFFMKTRPLLLKPLETEYRAQATES